MKKLVLLLFVCGAAAAAPLKPADIPANPGWLLHIDCDALRQTYIGQYLLYQMDKPEIHSNMLAFQSLFTFDIRTQLHGITMYGNNSASKDNVTIVYADFEPDRLITLAKAAPMAETTTNNQQAIYSWNANGNNQPGPRAFVIIKSDRVIMSQDQQSMLTALAVIDGTSPDLSVSNALSGPAAESVPFAQAMSRNMDFVGADPRLGLLKLANRAKFHACETNEQFNAVLDMEVADENTAKQVVAVSQGLVALLSLQKENSKAAALASGFSIKQDGATVIATVSIPSTDLIAALKIYTANKAKLPVASGNQ